MARIRGWMPLGIGLTLLVALGLFGYVLMEDARATAEEALRETAVSREQTLAILAQQYNSLMAKEAFDFAESTDLELTPDSEADAAALRTLLGRRGGSFSHAAVLADLEGQPLTVVADAPGVPEADDPGYAPMRAGLVRGEPGVSSVMDVDGVPVVAVGVPVLEDGVAAGILVAYSRADTSHLQAYSEQLGRAGGEGVATMVLDSDGTVVAAHDADLVGQPAPASPAVGPDAPATGFDEFTRDRQHLVVAHARESSSGWTLLREQDAAAFYAPVATQSQTSRAALLAALLVGAIVAIVLNHRTHQVRRHGELRSQALVEDASDVITIVDSAGVFTYISPTMRRVLGYDGASLVGTRTRDLLHPDDVDRVRAAYLAVDDPNSRQRLHVRMLHADGGTRSCELVISNQQANPAVQGVIASFRDVSELVELHDQLAHQARHDPLTELPNRSQLERHLDTTITRCPDRSEVAVLFADLDGFKPVNDRFGHGIGDALLVGVAARLREAVRDEDLVARLGGDEFVVVVHGPDARRTAATIAERILAQLRDPFELGGTSVDVGVSIGVAVGGPDTDPSRLLREADRAMYRAKERGRRRYEFAGTQSAATV